MFTKDPKKLIIILGAAILVLIIIACISNSISQQKKAAQELVDSQTITLKSEAGLGDLLISNIRIRILSENSAIVYATVKNNGREDRPTSTVAIQKVGTDGTISEKFTGIMPTLAAGEVGSFTTQVSLDMRNTKRLKFKNK